MRSIHRRTNINQLGPHSPLRVGAGVACSPSSSSSFASPSSSSSAMPASAQLLERGGEHVVEEARVLFVKSREAGHHAGEYDWGMWSVCEQHGRPPDCPSKQNNHPPSPLAVVDFLLNAEFLHYAIALEPLRFNRMM